MYLAKVIRNDGNIYLYDALANNFYCIDDEEILANETMLGKFLKENGIRDVRNAQRFKIIYPYTDEELYKMINGKVKSVTLALTEQCNLRCQYCGYMEKYRDEKYKLKYMSEETAYRAIDFLMSNSEYSEVCNIGFYGGEPLINIDLIKKCLSYVKDKYPFRSPTFNMVTNALLLNDDIIEFIISNEIKLNISMDGPSEYYNRYRVDGNNINHYEQLVKNILKLYKRDPNYFRNNVTYNVVMHDGINEDLLEAIDNMWKLDVNMIDLFETDFFRKLREKESYVPKKETVKIDAKKYDFTYKSMLKNMKRYYNSLNGVYGGDVIFPGGFCIPGIRKNFVTADGTICVCEKVDENNKIFDLGDVYGGLDIKKIRSLIEETLKCVEKCKDCWAAKFCKICFKDLPVMNEEFCDDMKNNIEQELGDYLSNVVGDRKLVNEIANVSLI